MNTRLIQIQKFTSIIYHIKTLYRRGKKNPHDILIDVKKKKKAIDKSSSFHDNISQQTRNQTTLSEPDKNARASIIFNDERLIYSP